MKYFFALSILIFAFVSCNHQSKNEESTKPANYLNETCWHTSQLLCLDVATTEYTLTAIPVLPEGKYHYGDFVNFVDSANFISYYSAPCGNDCFRSVYGKYNFRKDNEIIFLVDSITYRGECRRPTFHPSSCIPKIFSISRNDSIISLKAKKRPS